MVSIEKTGQDQGKVPRKFWIFLMILIWILVNIYVLFLDWNSQYQFSENIPEWGFRHCHFVDRHGVERDYSVFIPQERNSAERLPVLLFLHGSGQRGTNGIDPLMSGLGPAIWKRRESFPFLTIFPHCLPEQNWNAGSSEAEAALEILDKISDEFSVDSTRVYMTGFSMGGAGAWSIGASRPNRFAAVAPVCGFVNPEDTDQLTRSKLPVWGFCGEQDSQQTVDAMRKIHKELQDHGVESKYTEYPGTGHNCWDLVYDTDELYTWFLQHERRPSN